MAQIEVARRVGQLTAIERALLVVPTLVGLALGLFPLFAPLVFAQVVNFPANDIYVYQIGGAAALGYGVALLLGMLRGDWLELRLPLIGTQVFHVAVLGVCLAALFQGGVPASVPALLALAVISIALSGVLLYRYRNVPRPVQDLALPSVRLFLVVGMLASGTFGLLPLFAPGLGTLAHLHIDAPFIVRLAGAASLGYAAMTVFAQRALSGQELRLPIIMAAIFNGVSGIVSLPDIFIGNVIILPWLIGPVGLAVLAGTLLGLRRALPQATPGAASVQV